MPTYCHICLLSSPYLFLWPTLSLPLKGGFHTYTVMTASDFQPLPPKTLLFATESSSLPVAMNQLEGVWFVCSKKSHRSPELPPWVSVALIDWGRDPD